MGRAAITIDVDSLRFYLEIHGIDADRAPTEDPIYTVAMPRFWALLKELEVPATLFLVGADAPRYADAFQPALETGSEIANHSFAHDYRLTQRSETDILNDLRAADEALSGLAPNGKLRGFRAPGYNISASVIRAVAELGYAYDSSLLPAPLYFAARAAAIGAYALRRRPSRSLVGRLRTFLGPVAPYRASAERPWRRTPDGDILEMPIACDPLTRVPLIGTTWVVMPKRLRRRMLHSALKRLECLTFEMHAIDLLDDTDAGIPAELRRAQADLRVPVEEKTEAFRSLFQALKDHAEVGTLAGIASQI